MIEEYKKDVAGHRKVGKRILIALIFLLIILITVRLIAGLDSEVIFPVKQVQIYGTYYVQNKEIIHEMGLHPTTSLITFNKKKAMASIIDDQRIVKVAMVRLYPGTIRVYIKEKKPVAVLQKRDHLYLVSQDSVILGIAQPSTARTMPFILLNENSDDIKIGQRIENFIVHTLLYSLMNVKNDNENFFNQIDKISITHNGVYMTLEKGRYHVYLGQNIDREAFKKLRSLIVVLSNEGVGKNKESLFYDIDMSFPNAAVKIRE